MGQINGLEHKIKHLRAHFLFYFLQGRIAQFQQENEEIHKELGKKLAEEEDKQIIRPKHEMKVQLPLENWYDLLALVPRRQLGMFAFQIGDRQFASILQLFLHDERREITLGRMEIYRPQWNFPSDRTMATVAWSHYLDHEGFAVDLPDWPMPKNVKSFDGISLNNVDMPVLDFLRKFQENNLLANVQLDFHYRGIYIDHVLPMLKKILPLISSIYSIKLYALFNWLYNSDEETQLLLTTMVAQTKILAIIWYNSHSNSGTWEQEISLNNNKTNENLVVKATADEKLWNHRGKFLLLILRHPSKAAKRKIEEDEKEILKWNEYIGPKRICLT